VADRIKTIGVTDNDKEFARVDRLRVENWLRD
jgi:predicted nucleic acid-binding protein